MLFFIYIIQKRQQATDFFMFFAHSLLGKEIVFFALFRHGVFNTLIPNPLPQHSTKTSLHSLKTPFNTNIFPRRGS